MYIMYICVLFLTIATRGFPEFPPSLCRSVGDAFCLPRKALYRRGLARNSSGDVEASIVWESSCWKENEGRQGNVMFKNHGVNQ